MGANLVNLNVNPCKMCMPMGAVSALYGIRGCMSILHGSQGCATYIRRHMATHYNEPVDIASTSLTEHGTVFGGEENLIHGLENLIELYHPEIIGVATTCLAETIGEDIHSIITKFREKNPDSEVKIIHMATAGYGGTQYEGFFAALRAVVSQLDMQSEKNNRINIITPMLSPADDRWLKDLLAEMELPFVLLPDLSDNLDGVSESEYKRLKSGGTALDEIALMAGARHTIELSEFISDSVSPAAYLKERYGVPYTRLPLPVSLRDNDELIALLKALGGKASGALEKQRGRFIDAMVDSHKYSALGRAAVFGEPDFVYSTARLCCENGIVPVVCATGAVCPDLRQRLEKEVRTAADRLLVSDYAIADDADFDMVENLCVKHGVNLMIGSSDGRRIAHKLDIPLIRRAFPIHDRVGGQRMRICGYDGALTLLDDAANALLARQDSGFREDLYKRYYQPSKTESTQPKVDYDKFAAMSVQFAPLAATAESRKKTIEEKTASYPCYTCGSGTQKTARMHLPVAPKCNIQCNYCVRKYDCPNESRPGVTTQVLSPQEAFDKYRAVKAQYPNLTVVGIAGPGDALANFEETSESLRLIREFDPDVTFCLSTNGLMLPFYAQELIDLGVTHVTVTMNTIDPQIGARIYKHVDFMGQRFTGVAGAALLLANQLAGIKYLTERGVVCKINTVVLRGLNEDYIADVAKKAKELDVYMTNIMQLIPVKGSAFECLEQVPLKEINLIRKSCEKYIKQMYHCRQCRADAIGTLDDDRSIAFSGACKTSNAPTLRFAVASRSGVLVDKHFGQADEFYIYESDGKRAAFVERRSVDKYCAGKEVCDEKTDKITRLLASIEDCAAVLALRIGDAPAKKLEEKGIKVITTYDSIENAVIKAAAGFNGNLPKSCAVDAMACGKAAHR